MRHALTLVLWAALCIGGINAFAHLRQLAIEHQSEGNPAPDEISTRDTVSPLPSHEAPSPAFSPIHVPQSSQQPTTPAIAIIIDDLGNQWPHSKRTLELQGDITLAILPFSPFSERLARLAEHQGREVILHAPMEPLAHPAWRDGLRRDMSEAELRYTLQQMLAALPTVRGVNNHMGSALTQERMPMDWVMDELEQRDLYFIDSRTSPGSQALASAKRRAIPSARRDVFLDNVRTPEAIRHQFDVLIRLARKRGHAIAIGHPYPETLAFLEQILGQLDELGVRLVPASHLLDSPKTTEAAVNRQEQNPAAPLSAETHLHQPATASTKSI